MLWTLFCGSPSRSVKARTAGCARSNGSPTCGAVAAVAAADTRAAASVAPARAHDFVGITLMLVGPESAARLLARPRPVNSRNGTNEERTERARTLWNELPGALSAPRTPR